MEISGKSILFRLNAASLTTTLVVWVLLVFVATWILSTWQQQQREEFLYELLDHIEAEFSEIVSSAEAFEAQPFDYPAFVEQLQLDEEQGLVFWHKDRLAVSKMPDLANEPDLELLADMPLPKGDLYVDHLPFLPEDDVVAIAARYPDFELSLLLMVLIDDEVDDQKILFVIVFALLVLSVIVALSMNAYLYKWALAPLADFASNLSQVTSGHGNFDIESMPDELKIVGSEINRLNAHFAQLQLEKDVALDKEKLFTVSAAHELLTPLTVLKSEVQLVAKQFGGDQYADSLREINLRIDRVAKTIEQLVSLARLEPDQNPEANLSRIDLRLIFEDNQALFGDQIDAKQLRIFGPEDTVENPQISGNLEHLNMLFKNLIENAVKYTIEQGKITYQLERTRSGVMFVVENQCEPIPDYMKQQIFEAFARRPGVTQSGSGLGLAITQQICRLHGYRIQMTDAKSTLGVRVEVLFGG